MARLGPRFCPKIPSPPGKFTLVPFLRSFPGNEAHKLFSWGPKMGFWVGAKKFMLKTSMCFFRPRSLYQGFRKRMEKVDGGLTCQKGCQKTSDTPPGSRPVISQITLVTVCRPKESAQFVACPVKMQSASESQITVCPESPISNHSLSPCVETCIARTAWIQEICAKLTQKHFRDL